MKPESIIVMIFSLLIVWGGFTFLLLTALKKNNSKSKNG